jgi:uncharacterized membrane protein YidH (DUF202 family)
MHRSQRRDRYRVPMLYVGLASVCSAVARAVGTLWVGVPLLVIGGVLLIIGVVKLTQTVKALPARERRKERRSMWMGAVGSIAAVAVLTALILWAME